MASKENNNMTDLESEVAAIAHMQLLVGLQSLGQNAPLAPAP